MAKFKLKFEKTERGFARSEFKDAYGVDCSLQESSALGFIWLGCEENCSPHHVTGDPLSPRMHLSREQVKALLPYLKQFVKTGSLQD